MRSNLSDLLERRSSTKLVISIAIPPRNEAENVGEWLSRIRWDMKGMPAEVVPVDSSDDAPEVIRGL